MDHKSQIQRKVEGALNSLDNISPASPAPFFYTRLEARMMKGETSIWERAGKFISRPVIAFVSIGLVLSLNTFALLELSNDDTVSKDQQEVAIADEYNRTSMFNYNIDNVQP